MIQNLPDGGRTIAYSAKPATHRAPSGRPCVWTNGFGAEYSPVVDAIVLVNSWTLKTGVHKIYHYGEYVDVGNPNWREPASHLSRVAGYEPQGGIYFNAGYAATLTYIIT